MCYLDISISNSEALEETRNLHDFAKKERGRECRMFSLDANFTFLFSLSNDRFAHERQECVVTKIREKVSV